MEGLVVCLACDVSVNNAHENIMGLKIPFASDIIAIATSSLCSFHVGGDGVSNCTILPIVAEHSMQVQYISYMWW